MLEMDELQKLFASFNVIARKEDIKAFFEQVDVDQDGTIDYDELMTYIENVMAEKFDADDIVDAFHLLDGDRNGEMSHDEIATAMRKADVGIPHADIVYLLEGADMNRDGKVSFSEFRSLLFDQIK